MFNDIEELQTEGQNLETTIGNLTELGNLLPKDSAVAVDLRNGYDDVSFPNGHIENGLKEALDLPLSLKLNVEEASVVMFDDDGRKGLFLASKVPDKQCRIGLPGFIPDSTRFFYGAIWGNGNQVEIYSNLGNRVFELESHGIRKEDIRVLYLLSFVLSKAVLKTEMDDETGEVRRRLSNVRLRSTKNLD